MMDQITDHMLPKGRMTRDEFINKAVASKSIQRRLLAPDEIADMAGFLASDQARGITGQAVNVCGGAVLF